MRYYLILEENVTLSKYDEDSITFFDEDMQISSEQNCVNTLTICSKDESDKNNSTVLELDVIEDGVIKFYEAFSLEDSESPLPFISMRLLKGRYSIEKYKNDNFYFTYQTNPPIIGTETKTLNEFYEVECTDANYLLHILSCSEELAEVQIFFNDQEKSYTITTNLILNKEDFLTNGFREITPIENRVNQKDSSNHRILHEMFFTVDAVELIITEVINNFYSENVDNEIAGERILEMKKMVLQKQDE